MKPARLNLSVIQGATFRQILRIMQSELAYRPITAIASTSPVRLTVDHDLPTDWPVWVRGVTGFPALNKEFPRALPHLAQVVDAQHLDINPLAATGLLPKGGELSYYLPVDLTGVDATLMVLDAAGARLGGGGEDAPRRAGSAGKGGKAGRHGQGLRIVIDWQCYLLYRSALRRARTFYSRRCISQDVLLPCTAS